MGQVVFCRLSEVTALMKLGEFSAATSSVSVKFDTIRFVDLLPKKGNRNHFRQKTEMNVWEKFVFCFEKGRKMMSELGGKMVEFV
jgi:hypothetical protein